MKRFTDHLSSACASFWRKIQRTIAIDWSVLVGYDFFISYRRSDASLYATQLCDDLRKSDFRCFLDDNDAAPGQPLTARLRRALVRSRKLIIIASPDLKDSQWVPQELAIFSEKQRDIIPINIQEGLTRLLTDQRYAVLNDKDVLWIDEDENTGPNQEPSPHVLVGLQKGFAQQRANRNLRLIGLMVLLAVMVLAGFSMFQRGIAEQRLLVARSQAVAAEARRLLEQEPFSGMSMALDSMAINRSFDAQIALFESLSALPKVKRIFDCGKAKAVGVNFPSHNAEHLAFTCLNSEKNSSFIVVASTAGDIIAQTIREGDARYLHFSGVNELTISQNKVAHTWNWTTDNWVDESGIVEIDPDDYSKSREQLQSIQGDCTEQHPPSVRYLSVSQSIDEELFLYTTSSNDLIVVEQLTGLCVAVLNAHTHNVGSTAFYVSGQFIASTGAIAQGDAQHGVIL